MSLHTKRAELVAALAGVEGLRAHTNKPTILRPGDAWPDWTGAATTEAGYALTHSWAVFVVCSGIDGKGYDEFVEMHLDEVWEALRAGFGWPESVGPASLQTSEGQSIPVLVYQVTSEE